MGWIGRVTTWCFVILAFSVGFVLIFLSTLYLMGNLNMDMSELEALTMFCEGVFMAYAGVYLLYA